MGFDNPVHLAIAAVIILLVLGPKRLPSAARAAGRGIREFKESLTGPRDEIRDALTDGDASDASSADAAGARVEPGQAVSEASAASTSSSPETTSKVDPDVAG